MPERTYLAGSFHFVLDGRQCGFLKSIEGGAATAEVVSETIGSTHFAKKHLGPVSYNPFVVEFGMSMTSDLYDWINASWTGKAVAKDGAILITDYNRKVIGERRFSKALVTEVTIPAMDGSSKDAAYFTLRFAPESARTVKPSGASMGSPGLEQKLWLPSNFRVAIDGVDCTRVSRVSAITVRQSVAIDDVGEVRYSREPGQVEFPNLRITLAETSAASWTKWFDDFVIRGNNDDSFEKKGSISLLASNLAEELLRIDLFNIGIFELAPDRTEANADAVATVTAHLYCERMELRVGGAPAKMRSRSTRRTKRGG
jgi:phage tail-like protein